MGRHDALGFVVGRRAVRAVADRYTFAFLLLETVLSHAMIYPVLPQSDRDFGIGVLLGSFLIFLVMMFFGIMGMVAYAKVRSSAFRRKFTGSFRI